MSPADLVDLLAPALGGDAARVTSGDSDRRLHSEDMTFHEAHLPDAVVYPTTTAEVSAVLALAQREGVAVTPFGVGSSLEGHVIPTAGGISLDLSRMDRIVEVAPLDLVAVVQAGVTRGALNAAAGAHGLQFPVDPGADATLGGMAATNASGTTTVRYGKMRANVLALEAVLPGGRIIRTGARALKTSSGYDLTSVLVGSEGTLAVITELTLRLHPIPEHAIALRISFPDVSAATRCAVALITGGVGVTRVELVDELNMRALNAGSGMNFAEAPCLFVECAGNEASVADDLGIALGLADAEGALEIEHERDPTKRSRIWAARHSIASSWQRLWPGTVHAASDTCVPLSELPAAIAFAQKEIERRGLRAGILGHVGDGNFHVGVTIDPDDDAQRRALEEMFEAIVADALARGGTCTGEHGIGVGKIAALEAEHPDLIPLYRGLKAVFDPVGIMNPGKLLGAMPSGESRS